MSSTKKPFWETNLNPITMFITPCSKPLRAKTNQNIKRRYNTLPDIEGHILSKTLMDEFNIGARKLKDLFVMMGDDPKFHKGKTYYSIENIEKIREMVAESLKRKVDMAQYISNQELMKLFNFNQYKAWDVATKAKLIKFTFTGNVAYYNREKAIEAFTKYKK